MPWGVFNLTESVLPSPIIIKDITAKITSLVTEACGMTQFIANLASYGRHHPLWWMLIHKSIWTKDLTSTLATSSIMSSSKSWSASTCRNTFTMIATRTGRFLRLSGECRGRRTQGTNRRSVPTLDNKVFPDYHVVDVVKRQILLCIDSSDKRVELGWQPIKSESYNFSILNLGSKSYQFIR